MNRYLFAQALGLILILLPLSPMATAAYIVNHFLVANPAPASEAGAGLATLQGLAFAPLRVPAALRNREEVPEYVVHTAGSVMSLRVYEQSFDTVAGAPVSISTQVPGRSKIIYEATAAQDGARSLAWGFDSGSGISLASNAALMLDFSVSATQVYGFAADLLDLEGGNSRDAFVAFYDFTGELLQSFAFNFGPEKTLAANSGYGDGDVRRFVLESDPAQLTPLPLQLVAFIVGDDNGGNGFTEQLAMANLQMAAAPVSVTQVPLPAAALLLASGLGFIGLMRLRRDAGRDLSP